MASKDTKIIMDECSKEYGSYLATVVANNF